MEKLFHDFRLLALIREVGGEKQTPEFLFPILALGSLLRIRQFPRQQLLVIDGREGDPRNSSLQERLVGGEGRFVRGRLVKVAEERQQIFRGDLRLEPHRGDAAEVETLRQAGDEFLSLAQEIVPVENLVARNPQEKAFPGFLGQPGEEGGMKLADALGENRVVRPVEPGPVVGLRESQDQLPDRGNSSLYRFALHLRLRIAS